MIFGSEYQVGMPWMMEPEDSWLCKKSFSPAPVEEFRKDMREGACCVISKEEILARVPRGEEGWFGQADPGRRKGCQGP
jgi:hypothetical protein